MSFEHNVGVQENCAFKFQVYARGCENVGLRVCLPGSHLHESMSVVDDRVKQINPHKQICVS